VASAGDELSAITESVSTISGHVEGISSSAREQSASLAEVNTGVAQLDRVTQQNAAMVSQANDAGRTLQAEANWPWPRASRSSSSRVSLAECPRRNCA
jgi:methyl-accepting chemotaxis protein